MRKYRTHGPRFSLDAKNLHEEEDEPEIEIHNHVPEYEEEQSDENDVGEESKGIPVARFPADYHARIEGQELVIYDAPPRSESDRYEMPRAVDRRPRSVAELNALNARHYGRRKSA